MAKSIFGLLLSNSSVENFRAWGSALSAQLGAILTRVPQSNDIDWLTTPLPSSESYAGSEVYRFNDPLQATAPIFIKFEYGRISGSNTQIRATVGKTNDGDGGIGAVLLSPTAVLSAAGAYAVESCYVSGGNAWFALSLAPSNNQRGGFFIIERAIGTGGQPIGTALLVGNQALASAAQIHRFIDYANATAEVVSGGIVAIPLSLSSDRSIASGTVAPIFPAACISPAGVFWRPRVILGTARQNAGLGEVITGLIDGNSYLSLGAGSQGSDQRSSPFATTLIRWD